MPKTRVTTITCPNCHDEVFSRARHDFQRCKCGDCHVDGGFSYLKMGFKDGMPLRRIRYVKASKEELYDDWNKRIDKFGRIG